MTLKNSDLEILRSWGYPEEDIPQIKRALKYLVLRDENNKRVKTLDAYKRLGQDEFLSGLGRAAFHFTSERSGISFDCSQLFSEKAQIKELAIMINDKLEGYFNYSEYMANEISNFIIKQERQYGYGNYSDSDVAAIIRHFSNCDSVLSYRLAEEIRAL